MKRSVVQKVLAACVLLAALALMLVSSVRVYKVYDADADDWGMRTFHKIGERELVEDATFTGVIRKGAELLSTYDRTKPKVKRACPT
jgi:hypothetical protein